MRYKKEQTSFGGGGQGPGGGGQFFYFLPTQKQIKTCNDDTKIWRAIQLGMEVLNGFILKKKNKKQKHEKKKNTRVF